jgi:hypothetical protein
MRLKSAAFCVACVILSITAQSDDEPDEVEGLDTSVIKRWGIDKEGIRCVIGIGQRGDAFYTEHMWMRSCPRTMYCWEGKTNDIDKVRRLFPDYEWQIRDGKTFYFEYYVRGCGGYLGTPMVDPKFKVTQTLPDGTLVLASKPADELKELKLTLTDTSRAGATADFDISYTCQDDFCTSGAARIVGKGLLLSVLASFALSMFAL